MNYNPQLLAFQGCLISLNNTHEFCRINARGGNEDKILDIVSNLFLFLHERELINKDGVPEKSKEEMRKLTFYLLLNADFPVLGDLIEMPGLDFVIWTIPTIPGCLLCEIVWGLGVEHYVSEAITYCAPKYSLQILKTFVDSLKYGTPEESIKRIKVITAASYHLISRLCFYEIDDNLKNIIQDCFESFLTCLEYFIVPPNAEKINGFSEEEKYRFIGNNLRTLLTLTVECLQCFKNDDKFENELFDDLYLCSVNRNNITLSRTKHNNIIVMEYLKKCNTALLDKSRLNLMDIDVNIFCAFSEFEENGKSMQQTIGELCFFLLGKIENIESLIDHPITNILPQLSRKPVDIMDIIKSADDVTIVLNIKLNNEHKPLWLKIILEKDNYFSNKDFVECLSLNIKDLNECDCHKIVQTFFDLEILASAGPELKLLIIKAFVLCDNSKKEDIINRHFANSTFNNTLETTEFHSMITELFNKFINTDVSSEGQLQEILSVFIQNPRATYNKILNAAAESKKQCKMMTKLMNKLLKYCNHRYTSDIQSTVIKCFDDFFLTGLSEKQLSNFCDFIIALKTANILPSIQLLLLIIMPNLHRALLSKNVSVVSVQLRILDEAYSLEELLQYRAPLLAMLAQILCVVRWTVRTFDTSLPDLLEQTLQLQIKIYQTYDGNIPENELHWLKSKISGLEPLNKFYYRKLWNINDNNFVKLIFGDVSKHQVISVHFLLKVLSRATTREWHDIWLNIVECEHPLSGVQVLNLYYSAIVILTAILSKNHTANTTACLDYCYRNLAIVTKNLFLNTNRSKNELSVLLEQLAVLINNTEEGDLDKMEAVFLPLICLVHEQNTELFGVESKFVKLIEKHANFADKIKQMCTNGNREESIEIS